jgi:ribonuclease T1
MRKPTSGSKWMAIVAVALLAAFAWTTFRTPNDVVPGHIGASDTARGTRAQPKRETTTLETPPPMVEATATAPVAAYPAFLPAEAIDTLRLIERGGPYPYRQDDGVFGNRERRLPQQSRGYYREYTVETPGSRDRGPRRIIAGGRPPVEYFYTDDHYGSFRRFTLDGSGSSVEETSR